MDAACDKCGAPFKAGEIVCEFCGTAGEDGASAVMCPACHHANMHDASACTKCHYVAQCLFCTRTSMLVAPNCQQCGEAFAGMKERKAAHDEAVRKQQLLATGAAVLGAAVPILGALFGGDSSSSSSGSSSGSNGGGGVLSEFNQVIGGDGGSSGSTGGSSGSRGGGGFGSSDDK